MWCANPVLGLHAACVCVLVYLLPEYLHVCISAWRMHAVHRDGSEAGGEGE